MFQWGMLWKFWVVRIWVFRDWQVLWSMLVEGGEVWTGGMLGVWELRREVGWWSLERLNEVLMGCSFNSICVSN